MNADHETRQSLRLLIKRGGNCDAESESAASKLLETNHRCAHLNSGNHLPGYAMLLMACRDFRASAAFSRC
jgi:hypothetical protein